MTKRIFAGFLAVWFALVSSSAFAFLPLVMSAVRIAAVALETPQGKQLIAAPIGIGIAIVAAHMTRTDGTNTRDDDLYTTTAPRPPSATEAAAGFTSGSPSVTPLSTKSLASSPYALDTRIDMYNVCNIVPLNEFMRSSATQEWATTSATLNTL
ncbi:MAG: hypothetical protein WCI39_07010 [Gallionellaceae bacterium]